MMSLEHKASMLNNGGDASIRCLQNKVSSPKLQYIGDLSHDFSKFKDKSNPFSRHHALEPEKTLSSKLSAPSNDLFVLSSYSLPYIQKSQQNKMHNVSQNSFNYPMNEDFYFPTHTYLQCLPSQSYATDFQFQDFQYFVVIDFEATCDKDKKPYPQEIIEFPSVIVNSITGQLESSFQIYVRPTYNQILSDFCKELTGIQQVQVDKGVLLSEALLMHDKWLEENGIKHTNFAIVTWTNWDCRVMLESECQFKGIQKPPYFNRWINLKVPFHEVFQGTRCNLKEAVHKAGLVWEGRAHCGLDDAKNTARLLASFMHRGFKFSITSSLYAPLVGPIAQFQPITAKRFGVEEQEGLPHVYCYCGVKSNLRMDGAGHKRLFFFGCGNWTAAAGSLCPFFEWACP